ncbi:unnamed protein product [Phaedon cochleariae]|uniref:Glycolipid transfer protein domain-containing protein n=1 Tax=Phaedon cochleariae TaxID=80249 RepID=A0A9N9X3S1_PHACE|nr:unnamed protein product [Phaedon cochleariae]
MSRSNSIPRSSASPRIPDPPLVLTISTQFPDAEDQMRTSEFLDATTAIVGLAERFGKVFSFVTYDMNTNIQKLRLKYEENKENNGFLTDMILKEQHEGEVTATDALMWLRRELHFLSNFFQCVIDDTFSHRSSSDLTPFFSKAYTETLEQYHGWLGSQLLNVLSRFAPCRSSFLSVLGQNRDGAIVTDMHSYNQKLTACVRWLTEFYSVHGLETFATVILI